MPIRYHPRSIEEGKKIRLKDGIEALKTLWKYRRWKGNWVREESAQADGEQSDERHEAACSEQSTERSVDEVAEISEGS